MVWYSYTFKNCTQFAVIHTVRGFSVIDEAEVEFFFFFLELSCFFYDPPDVGNLISGSFSLSKSTLNIWKFLGPILLKPKLKDFEYYLASM